MNKPALVEMAEKDMDFEAKQTVKDLCKYADKICIERDFVFKAFLRAFNKQKVRATNER